MNYIIISMRPHNWSCFIFISYHIHSTCGKKNNNILIKIYILMTLRITEGIKNESRL